MTITLLLNGICLYLTPVNLLFYSKIKTGEVRLHLQSLFHLSDSEIHSFRACWFAYLIYFPFSPLILIFLNVFGTKTMVENPHARECEESIFRIW